MNRFVIFRIVTFSLLVCKLSAGLHNISLLILAPNPTKPGQPDFVGNGWQAGPALYPATRLAVQHINADPTVLPEFRLQYIEADTACAATTQTAISVVRDVFQDRQNQVVGMIGPGCSGAALAVSNLVVRDDFSLVHITQGNTPELEKSTRINTFASISSALFYVESFIALMKRNKWKQIATLVDISRAYFRQTHLRFTQRVKENGYELLTSNSLVSAGNTAVIPLTPIIDSKARIIFVFAQRPVASRLICAAYHKKMRYPDYQWIFHDRKDSDFFTDISTFSSDSTINCTKEQMYAASRGIILNRFNLITENETIILPQLNRSYDEYKQEYDKIAKESFNSPRFTTYANSYYDAVWAFAFALHEASRNGLDLKTYRYGHSNETSLIRDALFQIVFSGMSGKICFRNRTRSPRTSINIYQLNNAIETLIGKFDGSATTLEEKLRFIVPGDFIEDRYTRRYDSVNTVFGAAIIILTLVLAFVIFLLQMANIFWFNYHSIKATSPNINHLIFSGCYLFMIAIMILTVQTAFTSDTSTMHVLVNSILCNTLTWCFCLGYSLIFGTVCAKTWRVYRLFKHFQNESPGMCLGDDYLIFHVIILLAVDIVICTAWNVLDPWIHRDIPDQFPTQIGQQPILIIRSECICQHTVNWISSMVGYKGVVTLALVILSILNRKVKRKNFQHTKNINILIYGTILAACAALPLYFLLRHISIYIGFILLFLILMSTLVLCLIVIFLPPVLPVLKLKLMNNNGDKRTSFSKIFSTNSMFQS